MVVQGNAKEFMSGETEGKRRNGEGVAPGSCLGLGGTMSTFLTGRGDVRPIQSEGTCMLESFITLE